MNSKKFSKGQDIPLGLSMAMAQNPSALSYFTSLDTSHKQAVIDRTHSVRSKAEMQEFVDSMAAGDFPSHNSFS